MRAEDSKVGAVFLETYGCPEDLGRFALAVAREPEIPVGAALYWSRRKPEETMIKADIVQRVEENVSIPRAKASAAVVATLDALRTALGAGDRIELRGFGVFEVKPRKRGVGRNPKTGVQVPIPPGKSIRFKLGKKLREFRDGTCPIRSSRELTDEGTGGIGRT